MADGKGSFFGMVPLVLIAVLVYAGVYLMAGSDGIVDYLARSWDISLVSGDAWSFDVGTGILMVGLLMLFWEMTRATDSSATSIGNHAISMLGFIGCLLLFLLVKGFGTSVFFLLTFMMLFDVVGGFIVTTVSARRDFGGGGIPIGPA
jgi:hypothetical protein